MIDEIPWNKCSEKLPNVGDRVFALVIKELTYCGDATENSSAWMENYSGFKGIFGWIAMNQEVINQLKNEKQ